MPEGRIIGEIGREPDVATSELERRIVDLYQRDFPLDPRPYKTIGMRLGVGEDAVIEALERLKSRGTLGRIGAVVTPNKVGASTLAAMSVPSECLDEVAGLVSGYEAVNHNYEREHAFNLWFVVAGPDRKTVDAVLSDINARTGIEVLELPLEGAYHIDLGFKVRWND